MSPEIATLTDEFRYCQEYVTLFGPLVWVGSGTVDFGYCDLVTAFREAGEYGGRDYRILRASASLRTDGSDPASSSPGTVANEG